MQKCDWVRLYGTKQALGREILNSEAELISPGASTILTQLYWFLELACRGLG